MAKRISVAEFKNTGDASVKAPGGVDFGTAATDDDHAYYILDDSRVMLLSVRRYMPQ